ncbi:hypothetical protein CHELA1G11_12936 [Hyphomicrobiales bacterium]|nr:hypothetical protein CHELA1G2_11374 [Hyphomicrobiales bacterium]CAH1668158.1 hypothetical protein CHELA1G11_12936 [Hyphomicrobiales bacterium]
MPGKASTKTPRVSQGVFIAALRSWLPSPEAVDGAAPVASAGGQSSGLHGTRSGNKKPARIHRLMPSRQAVRDDVRLEHGSYANLLGNSMRIKASLVVAAVTSP